MAIRPLAATLALGFCAFAGFASAADMVNGGKLLLTGGVSTVEGTGGGGLATWATISGYGTRDGVGANVHETHVLLPDYQFNAVGGSVGLFDRVEFAYTRQSFDTGGTGVKLGLGHGFTFEQDVVSAKLRLIGDAIYDQDRWLPQIAVGAEYKHNNQTAIVHAVGATHDAGVDYYITATKLFLAQSLLVSGAVRWTEANQTGLLGFGGLHGYQAQFEGSAAYLLSRNLAVGIEYRTKPDNLAFAHESDWKDVFVAYDFNKHLSLTAAYADLGDIATFRNQRGLYLSLQAGF